MNNNSLFNELEMSLSDSDMDLLTKLQGSTPTSARKFHSSKRPRNVPDFDYGEGNSRVGKMEDAESIGTNGSEHKEISSTDTNKVRKLVSLHHKII